MTTTTNKQTGKQETPGEEQCRYALDNIKTLMQAFNAAVRAEDDDAEDTARQAIYEYPLSVEVRDTSWYQISSDVEYAPDEFRILLVFGGPLVQIRGETDVTGAMRAIYLQWQDWGTELTNYPLDPLDLEYLRAFVEMFSF